jgi:hypothetical protein
MLINGRPIVPALLVLVLAAASISHGAREVVPQDAARGASLEKPPLAADEGEKKILAVIKELDGNRRGNMNVPRSDGRMLRVLAESMAAKNVVELGTSNGYSAIWISGRGWKR